MLDVLTTTQTFGYSPDNLSHGSHKKVCVVCDYCQKAFTKSYGRWNEGQRGLNKKDACSKCKTKKQHESITPEQMACIQAKREQTNVQKYGNKVPINSDTLAHKLQASNEHKYGVKHSIQRSDVQTKIRDTFKRKYGASNPFCVPEIRQKCTETMIATYGKAHSVKYGRTEREILDFLNSLGCDFTPNHTLIAPKHLDGFSPSRNIAIEFCGLYWHTEDSPEPRDRRYHHDKYLSCKTKGVRLITVFQDEWTYHQNGVKNYLKSLCCSPTEKLFAKHCTIKTIEQPEVDMFLNDNHIQGSVNTSHRVGLFNDNRLVGVMTFSRHHRINDKTIVVLSRMAFLSGVQIVGGASKMLSFAMGLLKQDGCVKIVSWSDNRYSDGNVYTKLGFTLDKEYGPDYSYVDLKNDPYKRISKQSARKSDPNKTERQSNRERGLSRIWDCGKKRWVLQIP